jgi:putative transposase
MSAPKVHAADYIDFLIATPKACSGTEAARVHPDVPHDPDAPAHDAFTRLLTRLEPDPDILWAEARPRVRRADGVLVVDDSTLDKPYARAIALVTRHWSGKHHAVVRGINLVSLVWTDGDRHVPCDYRVYDTADGKTKNDHFAAMIRTAHARGFRPQCVAFDGWYSSLENLKLLRSFGWTWLTRLKSNRLVNYDRRGTKALKDTAIAAAGTVVWLPGYGEVKVFGIVAPDGDIAYWATNDLGMTDLTRLQVAEYSWSVEHYHRGIKQCTGIERCQCRSAKAQRNHIGLALRAFLRFEDYCFRHGSSWVEAKAAILREAVRAYLARPHIRLLPRPTA